MTPMLIKSIIVFSSEFSCLKNINEKKDIVKRKKPPTFGGGFGDRI